MCALHHIERMDKQQSAELRQGLFNQVLSAYETARQLQGSPNHPLISTLRAYLITHFGPQGRREVDRINREVIDRQKQISRSQEPPAKMPRLLSPGGKRPARPLGAPQIPPPPKPLPQNEAHENFAGAVGADDLSGTIKMVSTVLSQAAFKADEIPQPLIPQPLTSDERSELLTMKPRAAGMHFGIDRLRATLLSLNQDAPETMTQTQAAAALIAFLQK